MRNKLLTYSFKNNLSHIPSALSMLDYVEVLFKERFVTLSDFIVIGKPFGAQAYYVVWEEMGLIANSERLSVGVKHDEIYFVDYADETIGNALGVAIGLSIANPNKRVWVNISDATLQMGNTLEAIQFIGQHNLKNIFVTVDYNNAQVTGRTSDIISIDPCKTFFSSYGWQMSDVNGHDKNELIKTFSNVSKEHPNVIFCNTIKGYGVKVMADNIQKWHYRKISDHDELESML